MQTKKLVLFFIFLLWWGLSGLQAQQAITTTGGEASGDGGSVSYSIGQLAYITVSGVPGTVVPGVQQPYEISIITSVDDSKTITLEYSAYPNPTYDNLTLKIKETEESNNLLSGGAISYQLYNMNGELLKSKKLAGSGETIIEMKNYNPAIYFVKIIRDNKEIKTFKIIKK